MQLQETQTGEQCTFVMKRILGGTKGYWSSSCSGCKQGTAGGMIQWQRASAQQLGTRSVAAAGTQAAGAALHGNGGGLALQQQA